MRLSTVLSLLWLVQSVAASSDDEPTDSSPCHGFYCHTNGECLLANGMPFCICSDGYEGDGRLVCADKDECINRQDNVCDYMSGGCVDNDAPQKYSCFCQAGFIAETNSNHDKHGPTKCIEVNPCKTGSHECDRMHGSCSSHYEAAGGQGLRGSPTDTGYTCSCDQDWLLDDNGHTCSPVPEEEDFDTDPCDPDPCDSVTSTCDVDPSRTHGYVCLCKQGFFSPSGVGGACKYESPCDTGTHNCDRNADCVRLFNGHVCVCRDNFVGSGERCIPGTCSGIGDCDGGGATCKCLISEEKSMCADVAPGPVGVCSEDADCLSGHGCLHNYCLALCG